MNIPEGILCTRNHVWVLEEENDLTVGITDWQVKEMEDIVYVELPEVGIHLEKDEIFSVVESVRLAWELRMPVSGKIVEVNEELINSPEIVNEDCYENWLIKIKPDNYQQDSDNLIEYVDYIDEVR